jgi:hypothetical protein
MIYYQISTVPFKMGLIQGGRESADPAVSNALPTADNKSIRPTNQEANLTAGTCAKTGNNWFRHSKEEFVLFANPDGGSGLIRTG